jgi:hypothetical protein
MISFIFPSDPFELKKCEEDYIEEYNELKSRGYKVHLINVDDIGKVMPVIEEEQQFVYRGWMLKSEGYEALDKALNGQLLINTQQYIASHHLPQWYDSIKQLTIESIITNEENVKTDFLQLGWTQAFIKDYVKSLKTGKGSIVDGVDDIERAIKDMKQYRGYIEGGIVLREVKQLDERSEKRFFIINNEIYSNEQTIEPAIYDLLEEVVSKHDAIFYSVDVVKDKNDKLYLIEIGDGQVSGLVDWNTNKFIDALVKISPQKINNRKNIYK